MGCFYIKVSLCLAFSQFEIFDFRISAENYFKIIFRFLKNPKLAEFWR